MAYLMGVDLGTSSLKIVIADEKGEIKAVSAADYQFDTPHNGYAEQRTEVWWQAFCKSLSHIKKSEPSCIGEVKGISFSGQMHGIVFLDKDYREIRPAILHCDARSGRQVSYLKETLGRETIRRVLLNPIYTGFLLPSLLWVRETEPENYEKIRYIMLPKDYLKFRLCGRMISDYSDASATLAYDIQNNCWAGEILKKLNIPSAIFPECQNTDAVVGTVTKEASLLTGLSTDVRVVNGGGDQVMQAIGNGVIKEGQATVNIGTSGQVCFQSGRAVLNPQLNTNTFCAYEEGKWIVMGATMSAGLSLKWFNSLFAHRDYEELNNRVKEIVPGSKGLLFLPYLTGERTPHLNPELSGMFLGMKPNTDRYQMTRAVMEGVAYSLKQCLELCLAMGLSADILVASGGGARSGPWLQLQADIYNKALRVNATEEQAGLGAAIVAGSGVGSFSSIEEGCRQMVHYKDRIYTPDAKNHAIYEEYYELYKRTYEESSRVLMEVTELGKRYG